MVSGGVQGNKLCVLLPTPRSGLHSFPVPTDLEMEEQVSSRGCSAGVRRAGPGLATTLNLLVRWSQRI